MKNHQKGIASLAVILIVIGGIVAGGVGYYLKKDNKSPSNESGANNNLVEKIQEYKNGNRTGEWQIYKNEIYGFEVQYPPYGFITRDGWRFSADYGDYYIVEFRIPSPPAIFIDVEPKKNCEKYDFQNSNMTINGIPAIKEINKSSDGTEYRNAHFIKGEQCYAIQMFGPEFEDAEKMLTTFSFYR